MPILRYIAVVAALVIVQIPLHMSATAQTDAGAFIGGGTDVPLMEGLAEVEGTRVVFDKSSGRIIETRLRGRVTVADVRAFYLAALGQLGWTLSDEQEVRLVFVREQERLVMDFDTTDDGAEIRVLLGPGT